MFHAMLLATAFTYSRADAQLHIHYTMRPQPATCRKQREQRRLHHLWAFPFSAETAYSLTQNIGRDMDR